MNISFIQFKHIAAFAFINKTGANTNSKIILHPVKHEHELKKREIGNIKYLHSTDIKGKLNHNLVKYFAVQTEICEWIYSRVDKSKQTKCMHKK